MHIIRKWFKLRFVSIDDYAIFTKNIKMKILYTFLVAAVLMASCKEVPIIIDTTVRGEDTTYVTTPEAAETKIYLAEELSGVTCVNCPAGAAQLQALATSGIFANRLKIVTYHAGGQFTKPITGKAVNSIQDFRTTDGEAILSSILGQDPGKPCAGFDRLPVAISGGLSILDYKSNWESMLNRAKDTTNTTPVNVSATVKLIGTDEYDIAVKVAFTESMNDKLGLSVFLTESKIMDAQEFSVEPSYREYEFEHVFRKAISTISGIEILPNMVSKEAGRVLIQHFTLKINKADPKQAFWKPENMSVVAFVHRLGASSRRVFQVNEIKLIP